MTKGATLAQFAIASLSQQERSTAQASNWLQCSIRSIRRRLANGTFKRTLAESLLANNARDFARLTGNKYTHDDLTACANLLCDWILTTE